jgi:hypothetical protein
MIIFDIDNKYELNLTRFMKNKIYVFISALLIAQFSFAAKPVAKTKRNVSATGFIQNKGQIIDQNNNPNPAVKYLYHGNGLNVQLKANGFSYDTYTIEKKVKQTSENKMQMPDEFKIPNEDIAFHFHRIDVNLIDANQNPTIVNAGESEAYYNYFTTGTPEGGVSNVHSFEQVTYLNIYPNIDLQFICDAKKGFKYNFIVHPGGDHTQIKLQYKGAEGIKLDNGEIVISTSNGNVTENIPLSYLQETSEEVNVNYKRITKNEFAFEVKGSYSPKHTLVIDPTPNLVWATYFGTPDIEMAEGLALDASNNVYTIGRTSNVSALATTGAYQTISGGGNFDALIAKFNSAGSSLLWCTYYGGPGNEIGYAICVDASNNVYITGETSSSVSIATAGAYQTTFGGGGSDDAFVAKFNSTGSSLLWGTYYGGIGYEFGYEILLDASNNVYVTGYTESGTAIATAGAYQTTFGGYCDAFVAKFSSTGSSLLWGTYYGGGGSERSYGMILDASNNIYITGYTGSTSSIATAGAYQTTFGGNLDVFVAKFNSTGSSLLWGTYYGGTGAEGAYQAVLDASNNVYIIGETTSTSSIATAGAYQTTYGGGNADAFVAKFNSTGSSLLWGTYYGGTQEDFGHDITIDAASNLYTTGFTQSASNIATAGAYQTTFGGVYDAYVAKFNSTGSLFWGTYYGGPDNDRSWRIVLDASNNIYISGFTMSTSGLTTAGAYQTTFGGASYYDALVAKFNCATPAPGAISGSITNCAGSLNTYTIALVTGATSYSWSLPGAWTGTSTTNTISATTGTAGGNISVSAINACGISSAQTLSVTVNPQPTITVNSGSICSGNSFTIIPNGANTYTIQVGNAVVSPTTNSSYTVTGTSTAGCVSSNTAISNVTVNTTPTITVNSGSICSGNSFTIIPNGANTYTIQGGNAVVSPTTNSSYTVMGLSAAGCISSNTAVSNVSVSTTPTISVNSGSICSGNSFTIVPSGATTYTIQGGNAVVSPTLTVSYTVTGTNTAGCVSSNTAISNVTVNTTPTITVNSGSICAGNSFTIIPIGASAYTIEGGSAVVSPTANTSYSVIGTSTAGCISSNTTISNVTVTANALPTISVNSGSICAGDSFTIIPSGANTYTFQGGNAVVSPTSNASFTVTGTSTAGCVSSSFATSNVTVNPSPTITANTNNTLICFGQVAVLSASGAVNYTWNPGAATGSSISVSPSVTTVYTITGTNVNGCSSSATITQSAVDCTGLTAISSNDMSVAVYPNPFNSVITIMSNTKTEIEVFNVLGSKVYSTTIEIGKSEVDLSTQSKGIYFVRIGLVTKKLIKE